MRSLAERALLEIRQHHRPEDERAIIGWEAVHARYCFDQAGRRIICLGTIRKFRDVFLAVGAMSHVKIKGIVRSLFWPERFLETLKICMEWRSTHRIAHLSNAGRDMLLACAKTVLRRHEWAEREVRRLPRWEELTSTERFVLLVLDGAQSEAESMLLTVLDVLDITGLPGADVRRAIRDLRRMEIIDTEWDESGAIFRYWVRTDQEKEEPL